MFFDKLPIDFLEPGMVFELLDSVVAKSLLWLPHDQLIYEVNTFSAIAKWRNFIKLNLLCKDFLSDLLSILTDVGSLKIK